MNFKAISLLFLPETNLARFLNFSKSLFHSTFVADFENQVSSKNLQDYPFFIDGMIPSNATALMLKQIVYISYNTVNNVGTES